MRSFPEQPWLDGFNVSEDFIRQFIAMPLGEGFTAEEQITGKAEHGGLQIIVYPMKHEVYVELCREQAKRPATDDLISSSAYANRLRRIWDLAPGWL